MAPDRVMPDDQAGAVNAHPAERNLQGDEALCRLPVDDPAWLRLVEAQPSTHIFYHPAWIGLLAGSYGYRSFVLAIPGPGGEVAAGLPVMEIKGLSGRRWVSLPFSDHVTPIAGDPTAFEALRMALPALFQRERLAELEVRWELPALPAAQYPLKYVLHRLPLESDPNRVRSRFHSTHRRNIKTAENSGLRIEQGCSEQHLRDFYRLHLITRRRQGMPTQPWRFFQQLGRQVLEKDLGFVVLAYKEEACVAASVFLKYRQTLMYKYGASTPDSLQYRPNNLVMWSAIRWGCENGYTLFDMGRSDFENTGLRKYKSGWGAEEIPLRYSVLARKPLKEHSGRLVNLVQRVIRVSPVWVSRWIGELLYQYFG